jgi:ABC-type amino acid transport substrate-binding protein
MTRAGMKLAFGAMLAATLLLAGVAGATDLSKIQSRGYIIAVMSGGYPPFSMFNADQQLVGYDADVAKALAKQLGVNARIDAAEFSTIVQGTESGIFDMAVASQSYTAQRAKAVAYLQHPYHCGGAQLFVPKDSNVTSLSDMKEPVAVALGTTYEQLLKDKGIDFKTFKDDPTGIQAVESGIVGGLVTDVSVGAYAIKKGAPLKAAGPLLFVDPTYVTIAKDNTQLEAALNKALVDLYNNGTLKQIGMDWFGQDMAPAQCFNVSPGSN